MCQVPIWFEGKFEFSSPVELLANLCARLRGTPARFEDVPHGRSHTILIADAPIYIPVVPELESRFLNTTSKLLAKHDLRVVGYWVPEGAPAWDNTPLRWLIPAPRKRKRTGMRSGPTQSFKK